MLCMSLAHAFEVVGVAIDSDAAVALAESSQPDVAVIDVDMPKGGGLRAVRGILQVAPQAAVVVLSGDESAVTFGELMHAGAVAYCRKGIALQALVDSLVSSMMMRARERGGMKTSRESTA
jgi:DNA-binding NarL/FixJ family response regulator